MGISMILCSMETVKKIGYQGKYRLEVHGFDYDNTRTGVIESDGAERIALCMLDANYGGSSFLPDRCFPPMAVPKDGRAICQLFAGSRAEKGADGLSCQN